MSMVNDFTCDMCGEQRVIVIDGHVPRGWVKAKLVLDRCETKTYDICDACYLPIKQQIKFDLESKRSNILNWLMGKKFFKKGKTDE